LEGIIEVERFFLLQCIQVEKKDEMKNVGELHRFVYFKDFSSALLFFKGIAKN
jgi:hypothetical protein